MIHEIAPHTFNNTFSNLKPDEKDYALIYSGNSILTLFTEGKPVIPTFKDLLDCEKDYYEQIRECAYYLFAIDSSNYFLSALPEDLNFEMKVFNMYEDAYKELALNKRAYKSKTLFFLSIHDFRELDPVLMDYAAATGYHMFSWISKHKFCGVCGSRMTREKVQRSLICTKCGRQEFPEIAPTVYAAVIDKDRILLVKNKKGPDKNHTLVSGYVEIGESFEAAVAREVYEEVGLKVKNIKYYKNQPWGIASCQMIGFTCELDGSDKITLQTSELAEAAWFSRSEVPQRRSRLSVGSEMMSKFRKGEL